MGVQYSDYFTLLMSVTSITSTAEFEALLSSSGGRLVVAHFSAGWAPQCGQMREVAAQLAKDHAAVVFAEVRVSVMLMAPNFEPWIHQIDAENVAELSERYEVAAVPTMLLIKVWDGGRGTVWIR